jgi:hypothetical protein
MRVYFCPKFACLAGIFAAMAKNNYKTILQNSRGMDPE